MRDALIFVLLVWVTVLGYLVHSQNGVLTNQQREIKDLSATIEAKSKANGLQSQAECAKQSALAFKQSGCEKEPMAGYENHYNEKLNKCFVIMANTDSKTDPRRFIISKYLSDAFEGMGLGDYFWESDKVKKAWEVAPVSCEVTLPSGERKVCHSSDEFEELIKIYMQ